MKHLDLFSGIGGFALAAEAVWPDINHVFVEYDPFCQQVLRKHWPQAEIHGDIRQFIADTVRGIHGGKSTRERQRRVPNETRQNVFLLTGGFPCQPFSQAGRRKGTADNRYLWPEMFRVIQLTKPQWVIAENVRGLVTWNDGLVLEQVCADLESERYEVQPFIIPAVAVNAPHRRDRVWIVANCYINNDKWKRTEERRDSMGLTKTSGDAPDARRERPSLGQEQAARNQQCRWSNNWIEVATELCRMDDGLPAELDGLELSKSAHRRERLKSLGNAIVPQVAVEIMRAISKTP